MTSNDATLCRFALSALGESCHGILADADAPEARYLLAQRHAKNADETHWTEALTRYVAHPHPHDRRLLALARDLDLTLIEVLAIALAAAVEDDMMVGRALAYLQTPVGNSRPTLGLLDSSFAPLAGEGHRAIDILSSGIAIRYGLITLGNQGAPRPERPVSVPLPLCLALAGVDNLWPGVHMLDAAAALATCPLPQSILQYAARHAVRLMGGSAQSLVIRGGTLTERRAVAAAIANAAGLRAVLIGAEKLDTEKLDTDVAGLGVWIRLCKLLPVLSFELGPSERRDLPMLRGHDGPMLAVNGPDGSVTRETGTTLTWTIPTPPRDERGALWRAALGDASLADELSRVFRHRAGRIAQLGRLATERAALEAQATIGRDDLAAVAWIAEGASIDSLAEPLANAIPDEALVTTPKLQDDLQGLLARCRTRDGLAEGLGPSITARYHPGVKALFCGPSGAGKTLAAGWLATKLGLPLYRVDLASVTSKYIGETEKNLAQLLARAETAEVMLLFDEADSLFGKRTEVRESNDRFANAQTNYLLQRIESFDGIALLTSNSRSRFDAAFMRRLDVIIDFPLPGPEERRALWLSHLGASHDLSQQALNQIAASIELAGGHIRNAVMTAAVRADGRKISFADIVNGITAEYRKLGKQTPSSLNTDSSL